MKKRLLILIVIILLITQVTGCGLEPYDPYEDTYRLIYIDHFVAQVRENEDGEYAIIFDLTELGKQQEILLFPSHIEGLPVKELGLYGSSIRFTSYSVKKIYFFKQCKFYWESF